jgi:hypothetical protein
MVIDMVDIQTPSEIANRTGQSNYLNFESYMRRFPSSSPNDYYQYRAGADQETLGVWAGYSNAFGVVKAGLGLEVAPSRSCKGSV